MPRSIPQKGNTASMIKSAARYLIYFRATFSVSISDRAQCFSNEVQRIYQQSRSRRITCGYAADSSLSYRLARDRRGEIGETGNSHGLSHFEETLHISAYLLHRLALSHKGFGLLESFAYYRLRSQLAFFSIDFLTFLLPRAVLLPRNGRDQADLCQVQGAKAGGPGGLHYRRIPDCGGSR